MSVDTGEGPGDVLPAEPLELHTAAVEEAQLESAAAYTPPPQPLFVYALGRIEARFPTLSVEKEFAQVAGRQDNSRLSDPEVQHRVLSDPDNRYLARMLCWVFSVREVETYILQPVDVADFALLVDAIRPQPSPVDVDVVIGRRGPVAGPDMCNGLILPIVFFDQIYSFDRDSLIAALPRASSLPDDQFDNAARHVLEVVLRVADNAGGTPEHRALNYLAMRYPEIYRRAAAQFDDNFSLAGVEVARSPLGGGSRDVVDAIFSYTHRSTGVTDKFAVSVDVGDEFPFLVSPMSSYYERSARG